MFPQGSLELHGEIVRALGFYRELDPIFSLLIRAVPKNIPLDD